MLIWTTKLEEFSWSLGWKQRVEAVVWRVWYEVNQQDFGKLRFTLSSSGTSLAWRGISWDLAGWIGFRKWVQLISSELSVCQRDPLTQSTYDLWDVMTSMFSCQDDGRCVWSKCITFRCSGVVSKLELSMQIYKEDSMVLNVKCQSRSNKNRTVNCQPFFNYIYRPMQPPLFSISHSLGTWSRNLGFVSFLMAPWRNLEMRCGATAGGHGWLNGLT